MKIFEQKLKWHDGNEPSESGVKLLICSDKGEIITITTDLSLRNATYAWYDVIAWAYINISDIKTAIANANVDSSWLEFLHKNATNI